MRRKARFKLTPLQLFSGIRECFRELLLQVPQSVFQWGRKSILALQYGTFSFVLSFFYRQTVPGEFAMFKMAHPQFRKHLPTMNTQFPHHP